MKLLVLTAAALASLAPAAAQDRHVSVTVRNDGERVTQGSGRVVRATRALAPFRRIRSDGPVQVQVTVGKPVGADVEFDDNLIGQVVTRVENGTLAVSTRGSYRAAREPVVRLTVPALEKVELVGSGGVAFQGLSGGKLMLHSAGSGGFVARSGSLGELDLHVSGSGGSDLAGLRVMHAKVSLSGSGAIRFRAEKTSEIDLTGSGSVAYGGPAHPEVHVTGSGRVRQLD